MDPSSPSWGDVFAHGIGGSKDLPIPLELTIAGAVAALTVSFTVLAIAWRTPRYDADRTGRPAPARLARIVDSRPWLVVWRVFGMLAFGYTVLVAVGGEDSLINPLFGIFYVLLWVGFVPASLLFGPAYKAISPVRTINWVFAKLTGGDPDQGVFVYPERLGCWPAAVGLYLFVWLELVYPFATELGPVRLWCAAYVAAMLVGGALFGNRFYEHADPFEVYSTLVSRMSIWGRRRDQLVVRSPLANLDTTPVRPGLVAVTAVLFGSTAFDSFKDSTRWVTFIQGDFVAGPRLGDEDVHEPRPAGLRARRRTGLHARHDADRCRSRPSAARAAQPVRTLDRADRDRLRDRALPDLPAGGRAADDRPT